MATQSYSVHQPYDLDLARARHLVTMGRKAEAYASYREILRHNPGNCFALHDLGCLASDDGHHSAARKIYEQLIHHQPQDLIGRINLGNILYEDGELSAARENFEFVLKADADFVDAHRGLGRIFYDQGDIEAADHHWRRSFPGQAITTQRYRGLGNATPLLLLGSARRGNIPTQHILDNRTFAVTILFAEYYKPEMPLPPHSIVFNTIGDADLCPAALATAEEITARTDAPVINLPSLVSLTGRTTNAARLRALPGVRIPNIVELRRNNFCKANGLTFPLLLRSKGFHNGQHFVRIERREDLEVASAELPGKALLAIEYLNAKGTDGMTRKYRVMYIGGVLYPLHLAISAKWKVHYLTSDMATNPAHRAEEERFLGDMPTVLGSTAMKALTTIGEMLGLDYVGFDFALDSDGSILLFEANPTMVIDPPSREQIWDYRRAPIERVLNAAKDLLLARARTGVLGGHCQHVASQNHREAPHQPWL